VTIESAILDIATLNKCDAETMADYALDALIETLQRDDALPRRSHAEWEIKLAPARQRIAEHVHTRIADHIARQDVLSELL
jgi:hypothetical protein